MAHRAPIRLVAVLALLLATASGTACRPRPPSSQEIGGATPTHGTAVRLTFVCDTEACERAPTSVCTPADRQARFTQGETDLTGDGVSELVLRDGHELSIIENKRADENSPTDKATLAQTEIWHSPPEWRVVDAALGDPNDDGRQEVMIAFWKPDPEGILQSHPFILGYREGRLRTLWGGSPVAEPIYELELGDIDGDGNQELIVLDAMLHAGDEGARTISAWRWHGWGFSLIWRSAPAHYHDLVILSGTTVPTCILVSDSSQS